MQEQECILYLDIPCEIVTMDICDTQMLQDHILLCLKIDTIEQNDGTNNTSRWDLHEMLFPF